VFRETTTKGRNSARTNPHGKITGKISVFGIFFFDLLTESKVNNNDKMLIIVKEKKTNEHNMNEKNNNR